jgi:membrane fusion protein, multidrug efflux system
MKRIRFLLPLMLALSTMGAALYFGRLLEGDRNIAFSMIAPRAAHAETPSSAPAVPVSAAIVRSENLPIFLSGVGTVQAYNTVAVKSRVDGAIVEILFREGQDVAAGDLLARIDPNPFEAQLQQQEAALQKDQALLAAAVLDLRRRESLAEKSITSQQSVEQQRALVDEARAQILSDQAQVRFAKTQLDYTFIMAPISGRVGIRQIDAGNIIHAGDAQAIVVLTQLQPISVLFTVSAAAAARSGLAPGMTHLLVEALAADGMTSLDQGAVDIVDNQVDQATGTIKLKASFPNAALHLWPGDFVNGRIIVEMRHDALTVLSAAVRHGPHGDFVWLVRADRTVEPKTIIAGQSTGNRTHVERGLEAGDKVVIDGYFRLDTGSPIEVVRTEGDPVPTAAAEAR